MAFIHKKAKFEYWDTCENKFQLLKDNLTSILVLAFQEGTKGFIIYYDAFPLGLDYVIIQYVKVIEYASRQIKVHEKNYQIHDPELAGEVFPMNYMEALSI